MTRRVKLAAALHRTADPVMPSAGTVQGGIHEGAVLRVEGDRSNANATGAACRSGRVPSLGRVLSSAVYGAGYYASFGIVFSVMTVWHLLPLDNALGRGLSQGGNDALVRSRAHGRWRAVKPGNGTLAM